MSFVLEKTISINKKPPAKFLKLAVFRVVDDWPVVLKFEYFTEANFKKASTIRVTNPRNGSRIEVKAFQCEFLGDIDYEVVK